MLEAMDPEPLPAPGLAAFVAVVESGTLHGAADELGLTQSAVTKRIQALERRAGVTLLDRGRLGAQPTDTGRLLYPEAKEALAALGRAAAVMARANEVSAHALRIAASHTLGEFLVPRWLADFRTAVADPMLHADVDIANSPRVVALVRAGEAEVGFVEGRDELRGLESLVLARDTLVVVVAADHPWARRRSVGVRDLRGEAYLTRERDSGTRAVVTAALAGAGVELEPALVTPSIRGLKRAVLGGGFTVLSPLAVEGEVTAGTLRALRVRGVDLGRELRAIRDRRPARGSAAGRLWSWLRQRPPAVHALR
jgi:DNA-binding transcriptional LysR family regulator